jgi:hypothetical protein
MTLDCRTFCCLEHERGIDRAPGVTFSKLLISPAAAAAAAAAVVLSAWLAAVLAFSETDMLRCRNSTGYEVCIHRQARCHTTWL